jgi:hypothetical protein
LNVWQIFERIMRLDDFSIGDVFLCGDRRWKCTDIGTRVIVAVSMDDHEDSSWLNGPPFAVAEVVFDEFDVEACSPCDQEAPP